MKINTYLFIVFIIYPWFILAQQNPNTQQLDSIIINSTGIDLPFSKYSRTITVITSKQIQEAAATNVADLLQQVAGVDVRRRGISGTQSDLYIRGGGFDQTLLLIDGIKVEDAQTGHHTMNLALPLAVIERIEIIKGPAARVFGQNAFTGAINIVTKKHIEDALSIKGEVGSFHQKNGAITVGNTIKETSHFVHVSKNTSEGYRYNTDYDNTNYFLKSTFNKAKNPVNVLAIFSERNFGANGFYATPSATEQYEETQTSLLGISTTIKRHKFLLKPRVYWRRNQDLYLFIRNNPPAYRNLHITNKVGAELNTSYKSNLGVTGFGIDLSEVYLSSNNLGDRNRFMATLFLEHRFALFNDKLDITPGVAVTYFSDFKFYAFPGIDIGYAFSNTFKAYANVGYTYRIPTYTDLFYSDPTTIGNENLEPEKAVAEEIGLKYNMPKISLSATVFNRDSKNLIDYVKEQEADLWQAVNLRKLNTKGLEFNATYRFNILQTTYNITTNYAFLKDNLKAVNVNFSQYSINSLKHQITAGLTSEIFKNSTFNINYKYTERALGESYSVVDAKATYNLKNIAFSVLANNIFNAEYTETNLIPMPKGNMLFSMTYNFN